MLANHLFTVTESAVSAAKKQLENRGTPKSAIRLGIKGGGCSGFSYVVQFDDNVPTNKDVVIEKSNVKFFIDSKSLAFLKGSTLDYVKALMYEGYRFINPSEETSCGCGNSFSLKADKK